MNSIRSRIDRLFENDASFEQQMADDYIRPGFVNVRVELEDGDVIETEINAQVSDDEIQRYYRGARFDKGDPEGPERMVAVKNVTIQRAPKPSAPAMPGSAD